MTVAKVGHISCWTLICVLTLTTINGQTPPTPRIWTTKVKSLIPDNYDIMDIKFGHLNNDTLTDALLIIKSRFEDLEDSTQRDLYRPLLLVIQQKDKSFKVVKRNDHIVLCKNCGGAFSEPYEGLFQVRFSGGSRWRWTRQIEFGYDPRISNWVLLDDSGNAYDGLQLDTIEYPKDIIYTSLDKGKIKLTIDQYKGDN
jgi:hypothetical protein